MSASVNKAIILGNVGSDPVVRETEKCLVANLSIATSDYTTKETTWHRVVFFGKSAETISTYIKKGCSLYVEGKIVNKKYTDKNGQEKYTSEIIASNFSILTFANNAEVEEVKNTSGSSVDVKHKQQRKTLEMEMRDNAFKDDEIPF
jgi:single-strand DNA-binding protein